jgi:hypothetical protein
MAGGSSTSLPGSDLSEIKPIRNKCCMARTESREDPPSNLNILGCSRLDYSKFDMLSYFSMLTDLIL